MKRHIKLVIVSLLIILVNSSARIKETNSKSETVRSVSIDFDSTESLRISDHKVNDSVQRTKKNPEKLNNDRDKDDKLARLSLYLGIASLASLVIPYVNIFSLPLALGAIVVGYISRRNGNKQNINSILGISFGFSVFAIVLIAIAVIIAALSNFI